MKRSFLLLNSLLLIAGLVYSNLAPAQIKPRVKPMGEEGAKAAAPISETDRLITVLNPGIAGKLAERIPLIPRLGSLEGKTLYMVDVQWGGPDAAYSVFEEMQTWLAKNMPGVKTVLRRTKGNIFSDDPALWKEIGQKGDGDIVGIAG